MSLIPSAMLGSGGVTQPVFTLSNSALFEDDTTRFLSRTFGSPTDSNIWTLSFWMKATDVSLGVGQMIFSAFTGASDSGRANIRLNGSYQLELARHTINNRITTATFKDPSDYINFVIIWDTDQGTAADRIKIYANNIEIVNFDAIVNPSLSETFGPVNTATQHTIGINDSDQNSDRLNAYLGDFIFVDGQALSPTDFGEDSTKGRWVPIEYVGTYGNNGFHLDFSNGANLGEDSSGNNNDWTNVSSNVLLSNDSPTTNLAVLNPLHTHTSTNMSNGNLTITSSGANQHESSIGTIQCAGKVYFEGVATNVHSNGNTHFGISREDSVNGFNIIQSTNSWFIGGANQAFGIEFNGSTGQHRTFNGSTYANATSYSIPDDVMIAFDADAGNIWIGVNGSWIGGGDPGAGTSPTYSGLSTTHKWYTRFGVTNGSSSLNVIFDENSFNHSIPSGFVALSGSNLSSPDVVPSENFSTVTYTATGSSLGITGVGFQPDLVWNKCRNDVERHDLFDSVRGTTKSVHSDAAVVETTDAQSLTSFDSDGYTVGTSLAVNNSGTGSYVSWQWKADNTSGSSNTDGTITSTVAVNTLGGFSIVEYTGNGTAGATVGHGLGVAPEVILIRDRQGTGNWRCYFAALGNTKYLPLDTTSAEVTDSTSWNNTSPSSSVFTLGSSGDVNLNTHSHISYCFASIDGFSKLGSYTGNGSTDGPFVYTGFKPAYIMIKCNNSSIPWRIFDTTREPFNLTGGYLEADSNASEVNLGGGNTNDLDILSNGFKLKGGASTINGGTSFNYVYMAFAEYPFSR